MVERKISKIDNKMEEKQLKKILEELYANLSQYQEQELNKIRQQVMEMDRTQRDDLAIEMFVCDKEEIEGHRFWYEPLYITGMQDIVWGTGVAETVYLAAERKVLEQLQVENTILNAIVTTNYETYPVKVSLRQATSILEITEKINYLLFQNDIDIPKVNDGYAKRFFEVYFFEVKDKLREDEKPQHITVSWGALEPYVREDKALMWNVRKTVLCENTFPVAISDQKEVRYRHELIPNDKENTYLLELEQEGQFQVKTQKDQITVVTMHKQYQNWTVYEIISTKEKDAKEKDITEKDIKEKNIKEKDTKEKHTKKVYDTMTNRKRKNVFDNIRAYGKLSTEAEIYRNILAYEMAEYFEKIEINQDDVFFYPKDNKQLMNEDAMYFILEDLAVTYPGIRINGHLVTISE